MKQSNLVGALPQHQVSKIRFTRIAFVQSANSNEAHYVQRDTQSTPVFRSHRERRRHYYRSI